MSKRAIDVATGAPHRPVALEDQGMAGMGYDLDHIACGSNVAVGLS
jgi:hypothetical protein